MKKYFLAIAAKDAEFFYKKNTCIYVPEKSADKIAELLNNIKYWIKDETRETWHKYETSYTASLYIDKEIKSYPKSGKLKIYRV